MDSREELPRVSVGSVQDWQRLKINYKNAALARLEEHVVAYGLNTERDVLVASTNQFIDQTFQMAQRNLRINGQNCESLDENEQNTEPFDEALDRRIWSLADTRLQWQKRIAETRRNLPIEIEATITDLFEQQRAADLKEMAGLTADIAEDECNEGDGPLPRLPQMEEGFQKTLALGEELDQIIPSQEERAQRVKHVAVEVKALKS
ncbi:Kinetochore protein mis14 [Hypsizygus marmoreus]|uniref:Kinetochore protein mis14 n=1 Tax=Hypsizygus marmoreus TaxID=39966 RepID=A0A369JQ97_HYPMA|nr:Kinetochore protein mis14 [Hypsizygus marmoreus]